MAISEEKERASPVHKCFSNLCVMFVNIPWAKMSARMSPAWEGTAKGMDTSRVEELEPLTQSVYHRNCFWSYQDYLIPRPALLFVSLYHL